MPTPVTSQSDPYGSSEAALPGLRYVSTFRTSGVVSVRICPISYRYRGLTDTSAAAWPSPDAPNPPGCEPEGRVDGS